MLLGDFAAIRARERRRSMAFVIVVDGPEKAGKTTFIEALAKHLKTKGISYSRRKFGPTDNDYGYGIYLQQDAVDDLVEVAIWDRAWPSDFVYPTLVPEYRRGLNKVFWNDPGASEIFNEVLEAYGVGVILLGPTADTLEKNRDASDRQVPPKLERELYRDYGLKFGWRVFENQHTDVEVASLIEFVLWLREKKARSNAPVSNLITV